MNPLPIDPFLPEIVDRLRHMRAVVVVAPPGAGKTTRVAPAVLRSGGLGSAHPNVVMLQPRRVAARAAAYRIAEEQGWTLGNQVGYQIRLEKRIAAQTRLRVLTEGILTRQLLDDPELNGVGCVILDEFHERSVHCDLAIAMLREVRRSLREDLLLVVMSATLAAEPVSQFLDGCPIVRVEGRVFPVEIIHRASAGGRLPERAADAVRDVIDGSGASGNVLVFLPGAEEIRRTLRLLKPATQDVDIDLLPLHGGLPFDEQVRALRPGGRRKVILATNIAETSLTIDGVTTVIDGGYARVSGYDPRRGLDRLKLTRISNASARQRAGRAGRTAPGQCIRLWSPREDHELREFELPEVHRVDLCGPVLALHAWGQSDPRKFDWFEPPPAEMLDSAERLLEMLGAVRAGRITPLGSALLTLPVHPRIGRLLLAAVADGLPGDGAAMAALLEEKDIVTGSEHEAVGPPASARGLSDLLVRMDLLEDAERDRFSAGLRARGIDPAAARQVARTRDQLARMANRLKPQSPPPHVAADDHRLRWPLLAFPDRVVRRRENDALAGVMVGGSGIRLASSSVVRTGEFFVALDARHDECSAAREAFVRIASPIRMEWLENLFGHCIRRERSIVFDEPGQRVIGLSTMWYRDLLVREQRDAPVDAQQAAEVLAAALGCRAREIVERDEHAATWLARLQLLADAMPELGLPAVDDRLLREAIVDASAGKRSLDELLRAGFVNALAARLPFPMQRLMQQHAPETIEVPSGSRIRLDYAGGRRPILAVRLQEIFGWTETPRIAAGRVPVLLHILGPNFRPVQITDDLASFWKNTYDRVRKDLRIRYPRHSWPEDPLSARPEAKGGRRK